MAGLYIHVPFCKQKCTYCDFASYPKEIGKAESYFACLYREIEGRAKQYPNFNLDTVYIGGGTPSAVDAKFIAGAIRQVRKCFNVSKDAEITVCTWMLDEETALTVAGEFAALVENVPSIFPDDQFLIKSTP
jgi:coproporphyrinogen III oxidase-like Fe-S oxidoreductase